MKIKAPCIVRLVWHMQDSLQQDISEDKEPSDYFYGGEELFPKIEEALLDHQKGDQLDLYLEPEHAFGDYNSELVFFEARHIFPDHLEEGMQFEGLPQGTQNDAPADIIFNVTEIYDEHVVLDGNHPLAGLSLRLHIEILDVREASEEEIIQQSTSTSSPLTILSPFPSSQEIH